MNWDQVFCISWCKEVSLCFPLRLWPWWNCGEMKGMYSEKATERHKDEGPGYKMGIRLVDRPRGHGNRSMPLWRPTGTKTEIPEQIIYAACTCQGIDNRPGFYQTAPDAPISLLDGWLLIKFQCKSNHKKLPFSSPFLLLIVSDFHSLTQRPMMRDAYI